MINYAFRFGVLSESNKNLKTNPKIFELLGNDDRKIEAFVKILEEKEASCEKLYVDFENLT